MDDRKALAQYVILTIARDHLEGRRSDLDSITRELGAPRAAVRSAVSSLHREGYVDALRMKLTIEGFALGVALSASGVAESTDRPSIAA